MRWAAIGLMTMVAACSSGPRIIPEPERPPVTQPTPTQPDVPVDPGLPQDEARHRVALLVPMSGTNAGVGRSLANATQLALLDTNADNIRITTYDTATGAAAAATQAIADGNGLILGPLLADDVRAVSPIARRAHVPLLSFSNDVSVAGNGTYILGYVPSQSIGRVVDYARSSGITDFAGLMPGGLYGERASTAFLRAVEDAGGRVVAMETYDGRSGSLASAANRLGADPFQAVLIAGSGDTAAAAVPLLRRTDGGATARVLGTELWNSDSSIGSKSALEGAFFASVSNNYYRQYAAKYRSRFGSAPYRLSTLGYDSVLLTVRIARDWRVGQPFPEGRLLASDGFAGLDGAFRFGRDGIAQRALEVQEIRDGSTVTVSSAPRGF
ncbi:penicillin-binding protein activator [Stakelama tenebrarum]|nr:penicillin-binding protein activator [Sphingosinithalassobacter tenebrarum]